MLSLFQKGVLSQVTSSAPESPPEPGGFPNPCQALPGPLTERFNGKGGYALSIHKLIKQVHFDKMIFAVTFLGKFPGFPGDFRLVSPSFSGCFCGIFSRFSACFSGFPRRGFSNEICCNLYYFINKIARNSLKSCERIFKNFFQFLIGGF